MFRVRRFMAPRNISLIPGELMQHSLCCFNHGRFRDGLVEQGFKRCRVALVVFLLARSRPKMLPIVSIVVLFWGYLIGSLI